MLAHTDLCKSIALVKVGYVNVILNADSDRIAGIRVTSFINTSECCSQGKYAWCVKLEQGSLKQGEREVRSGTVVRRWDRCSRWFFMA